MSIIKISAPTSLRKLINENSSFEVRGNCINFVHHDGRECGYATATFAWDIIIDFMTNEVLCILGYNNNPELITITDPCSKFELSAIDRARVFSVIRTYRKEIIDYVRDILNDDDDDDETIEMTIDNIREFSRDFTWIC